MPLGKAYYPYYLLLLSTGHHTGLHLDMTVTRAALHEAEVYQVSD